MKPDHLDTEVEVKLAVRSHAAKALAERELAGAKSRALESIYFDTDDHRLRSAGYSLRVRRENGGWLQTVKSSEVGSVERYEHENRIAQGAPDRELLRDTPLAWIIGSDIVLAPIFATNVRRRSILRRHDGGAIEFSLDEGEIVAGERTAPILELELELKAGPSAALFAEAGRLARDEALVPAFASKADRGYDLTGGAVGEPAKFQAPKVAAETPTGEVLQAIGRACLRHLTRNAELIAEGGRIEAVHQARVSLRRLRVVLSVFKGVAADAERAGVRAELEWLTGELENARALDVFILESFRPAAEGVDDPDAMAAFGQALLGAQQRAYARAAAAIGSPRFRALVVETARWLEDGAWRRAPLTAANAAAPIGRFCAKALDRRRRGLKKRLARLDWKDPLARHKVRIGAKKMRYASEFFAALASGAAADRQRKFVRSLGRLQDGLGALNDIWVAQKTARLALAAPSADGADFAAGIVVGRGLGGAAALTRQAKAAAKDFVKARPWW